MKPGFARFHPGPCRLPAKVERYSAAGFKQCNGRMQKNSIHRTPFLAGLFSFLLVAGAPLLAEPVELRWKEVSGSSGYLVRVEKDDGSVIENRIGNNRVQLDLEPGNYVIRIAGLNKFGKPGPFSDPARVTIEQSSETRTIQMEEAAELTASEQTTEPDNIEEEQEDSADSEADGFNLFQLPDWEPKALVPGLLQYERGETYKLYLYNGLLLGHAIAGNAERQRGNLLSREAWNDPTNVILATGGSPASLGLLWLRRSEEKAKYNQAQANQSYIALSALLVYGWHFVDLYFLNPDNANRTDNAESRFHWQLTVSGFGMGSRKLDQQGLQAIPGAGSVAFNGSPLASVADRRLSDGRSPGQEGRSGLHPALRTVDNQLIQARFSWKVDF